MGPASAGSLRSGEPERYAADLQQLAIQQRRYLQTLEDRFSAALGMTPSSASVLPACDSARRLLAVEYARLHWRLRATSTPDAVEGWWILRIEPSAGARRPRPLLSELASGSNTSGLVLGSQPCLHFSGVRGAGEEVYDLIGIEGLLGVRSGRREGEVFAFMDRGASAAAAFRRLTGQAPGAKAIAVARAPTPGLRVAVEQTLTGGVSASPVALAGLGRPAVRGDGWDAPAEASKTANGEEVLDSWEDAA